MITARKHARSFSIRNSEYIYFGKFDPLPLTEKVDSWGRRALKSHRDVPRVH